jgi:hypothetical protein
MELQGPDRQARLRGTQALPVAAVVGATIDAVLGTGQYHIRLLRMHGQGADLWLGRQASSNRFPGTLTGQAAVQTSTHLASRHGFPGQADIHIRL